MNGGWGDLPALSRGKNEMGDVAGFVARWAGGTGRSPQVALRTSEFGNRNSDGSPVRPSARAVVPGDGIVLDGEPAGWTGALEDGVRELVPALVRALGCVTYSSCQGHDYRELGLPSRTREVCVLARTAEEADRLTRELGGRLHAASAALDGPYVRVGLLREDLRCRSTGSHWQCLSLLFDRPAEAGWTEYFAHLDAATATVVGLFDA
ncbi:hypothetical protein [Kitasatospora griseola]|uniref:hypothetical protein n=1 Tax=Kitasatospora griseola TaxID=2064 RepID=UPI0016717050|nr:hypothetical protein [Kitasatospora griseola]GGR09631.1 hypothetical protein GCM10010195_74930 [Kitasatospora griseola]